MFKIILMDDYRQCVLKNTNKAITVFVSLKKGFQIVKNIW